MNFGVFLQLVPAVIEDRAGAGAGGAPAGSPEWNILREISLLLRASRLFCFLLVLLLCDRLELLS